MKESKYMIYTDLIAQIDRIFPWYFIAMVLFFGSVSGTMISITAFFTQFYQGAPSSLTFVMRWSLVVVALLLPLYVSVFSVTKLGRIYRNRNTIHTFIYHSYLKKPKGEHIAEEEALVILEKTRREIHGLPRFIFLSYVTLIVSAMIILLLMPFYIW